jgi:hypothetical protein
MRLVPVRGTVSGPRQKDPDRGGGMVRGSLELGGSAHQCVLSTAGSVEILQALKPRFGEDGAPLQNQKVAIFTPDILFEDHGDAKLSNGQPSDVKFHRSWRVTGQCI